MLWPSWALYELLGLGSRKWPLMFATEPARSLLFPSVPSKGCLPPWLQYSGAEGSWRASYITMGISTHPLSLAISGVHLPKVAQKSIYSQWLSLPCTSRCLLLVLALRFHLEENEQFSYSGCFIDCSTVSYCYSSRWGRWGQAENRIFISLCWKADSIHPESILYEALKFVSASVTFTEMLMWFFFCELSK